MPNSIFALIAAFTITYLCLPPIIRIALDKKLYVQPEERSSHTVPTPSLGGVGIFGGLLIAVLLFSPTVFFNQLQYILVAVLIVFLTGLKDDLSPMSPRKKLFAQLFAAATIAYLADIRLECFHGVFSWSSPMPYALSLFLSVFTIIVITNAFNLIDGINGLAGSIGIVVCATFGSWFLLAGHEVHATLAFATAGALLAFLRYNMFPPTKIFMGDTGSLVLGTVAAVLTLEFIELSSLQPLSSPLRFEAIPVLAMTIISIPLFDTLRVFTTRIIRGNSPFSPDRRHIHHLLIDSGCSHLKATTILTLFNLLLIVLAFSLQGVLDQHLLLLLLFSIIGVATYVLHRAAIATKAQYNEINPLSSPEVTSTQQPQRSTIHHDF